MLTVAFVERDQYGVIAGAGWVILENGERIDWPMLSTLAEANEDLRDMRRSLRQLASDEASEQRGLRYMGA